ncbi:MAG: PaaI family thioesterase [Clostridia bacterium]|nr:PaaI family thioesterase [Clostridia bacterium]
MTEGLPDYKKEASITPYIAYNGIEIKEYDEGYCIGAVKIEDHHKNLLGIVHGGCVFTLADTVAGYTGMTKGTIITTLNASINYFHPVKDTEYLYCKGEIVKDGKTVTVVRTVIYGDKGETFADASFSLYNIGMR